MPFQITPLPKARFEHLFHLPAAELANVQAMRTVVTKKPGFPCRVSLQDAEVGEEVILAHYLHQDADSPFRASHAVYVRPNAVESQLSRGEVPEMLRSRVLSLRGFSQAGMLLAADLAEGQQVETSIAEMFRDPQIDYIHLHFAKPGCYAARVDRVA